MRSIRWLVVALASVFGFLGLLVGAPQGAEAQSYTASETELVELINAYRQENGLAPLSISSPLTVASERHSEDMGTYGFFSHTTQQSSYYAVGSGHSERIAQEGYTPNAFTAENLAYGQPTAQEAFTAWRNSPGHNAAMLGDYSVVGVGQVTVGGVPYWTAVFGSEIDSSSQTTDTAPSDETSSGGASGSDPDESQNGEQSAQAAQYDEAETVQPVEEQYEESDAEDDRESVSQSAPEEQYANSEAQDPDLSQAGGQYDAPETSAADEYRANAERLRAAADQYGAEAEQARKEAAALQAIQAEQAQAAESKVNATEAPEAFTTQENPTRSDAGKVASSAEGSVAEGSVAEGSVAEGSVAEGSVAEGSVAEGSVAGESEKPSEKMASVGMTVLPDTGGLAGGELVGGILGAALVVCVLVPARRLLG